MIQTLILHAGPYKTGTTALQKALTAGSGLLARHGVLYPATGRSGDSHATLAEALLRADRTLLPDLSREVRSWRVVLLSCEHFPSLSADALSALRDAVSASEIRVAYTLRRLVSHWPSHWAELVKHGQDLTFRGYLDRVKGGDDRPFHAPVLPARQIDRLATAFGPGSLRLAVYDHFLADGIDLGPAFVDDVIGLGQIAPHFATRRANPSPTELETALVCLMNRHAGRRADHRTKRAARRILLDSLQMQPDRLSGLEAALAAGPRILLDNDHPLVRAEHEAVLGSHADRIDEGLESYLAPLSRSLPDLDALHLDPSTALALERAFDAAYRAVRPDWPPVRA